jgi:hypothetical protein
MLVALETDPLLGVQPDDRAFVGPIAGVLDALGVTLTGPDRACTLE